MTGEAITWSDGPNGSTVLGCGCRIGPDPVAPDGGLHFWPCAPEHDCFLESIARRFADELGIPIIEVD